MRIDSAAWRTSLVLVVRAASFETVSPERRTGGTRNRIAWFAPQANTVECLQDNITGAFWSRGLETPGT
jgi:hypothetical protein